MASKRQHKINEERKKRRDELHPKYSKYAWDRTSTNGFTSIPRILPLMLVLLDELSEKGTGNPSRVYVDLWSRIYEDATYDIADEEELAYSAGYTGQRASRTWRNHIEQLKKLRFIETAQVGNRPNGNILILDPYIVAAYHKDKGNASDAWWATFTDRAAKVGAEIRRFSKSDT